MTLDDKIKSHVKTMAIQTLGTENARPAIAPQASLSSLLIFSDSEVF